MRLVAAFLLALTWLTSIIGPSALAAIPLPATAPFTQPAAPGRELAHLDEWIHVLALTRDGSTVAVGTEGKAVHVFDAKTGRRLALLPHNNFVCEELKFSEDGNVLYALTWNGLFDSRKIPHVWRLFDGKPLLLPDPALGEEDPLRYAFWGDLSPDGKSAVFGTIAGPPAFRVELDTGRRHPLLSELSTEFVARFTGDPNIMCVVTTDDVIDRQSVGLYGIDTGRPVMATQLSRSDGSPIGPVDVAGSKVLTTRDGESLGWLDMTSGRWAKAVDVQPSELERSPARTPDGRLMLTTSRDGLRLYDLAAGREVPAGLKLNHPFEAADLPRPSATEVAMSADGSTAVTASTDGWVRLISLPAIALTPSTRTTSATRPAVGASIRPVAGPPVKVFFDTDMQTDCDDAAALGLLHALADRGEAEVLATVTSVRSPWSAACVDAINTYYGRGDLPLGSAGPGAPDNPSKYARKVAEACPRRHRDGEQLPDAVDVYRSVLEAQPDGSVVLVTVGYLTNVARLLAVPAEGGRPSGRDLAARKVAVWVCMGGNFVGSPAKDDLKLGNVNFTRDAKSAKAAIDGWPGRIEFVGREVASVPSGVKLGARLRDLPADHPVRLAYRFYFDGVERDRHVADPATVLFAVRGYQDYWLPGPAGRMDLRDDMTFEWHENAFGQQRYLLKVRDAAGKPNDRQIERILEDVLLRPGPGRTK